jgi:hypothetical protein
MNGTEQLRASRLARRAPSNSCILRSPRRTAPTSCASILPSTVTFHRSCVGLPARLDGPRGHGFDVWALDFLVTAVPIATRWRAPGPPAARPRPTPCRRSRRCTSFASAATQRRCRSWHSWRRYRPALRRRGRSPSGSCSSGPARRPPPHEHHRAGRLHRDQPCPAAAHFDVGVPPARARSTTPTGPGPTSAAAARRPRAGGRWPTPPCRARCAALSSDAIHAPTRGSWDAVSTADDVDP